MRRTALFAATTLLALSLAPALEAQYRRYPDRDRYDRDRYGYDRGQSGRIAELAREIDEAATYIYHEAARNNRRPNRAEARVLADLRQLDQRAEQFRYRAAGYSRGASQTSRYFAALEGAFFETAESLRYIEERSYIERGMDRIYTLLNEVSRYYDRGYRSGYDRWDRGRGGWSRSDRYGRDERRYGQERYRDYYRGGYDDDDHRRRHDN
ncbi:MAG TPA: hypothetical protein VIW92_01985 [Thermoanaerobaculia bacterium]